MQNVLLTTLGNMRQNSVRTLAVYCDRRNHEGILDVSGANLSPLILCLLHVSAELTLIFVNAPFRPSNRLKIYIGGLEWRHRI
jgi:hypothetical protein